MNCCEKCDKSTQYSFGAILPEGKVWCADCLCHKLPDEITYKSFPASYPMKVTDTTSPEKNDVPRE